MYRALPEQLCVRDSNIAGQGIFAKTDIPTGTYIVNVGQPTRSKVNILRLGGGGCGGGAASRYSPSFALGVPHSCICLGSMIAV